jgi:3-oxoacyl-[acyl-carrier protein] reductase
MSDRYQSFTASPIGQLVVKNLGLPNPTKLERYQEGAPLVDGTVVVGGGGRLDKAITLSLDTLGIASTRAAVEGEKYKGLVFDATGLTSPEELVALQQFLTPLLRSLTRCARVVVIGTNPQQTGSVDERIAQRALEGVTRSLGKEIGNGSTVNLVYVAPGAEDTIESTLAFFLSPKSAYVSGQVARLGLTGTTTAGEVPDPLQPLAGKVAIVTGASRGIGEQIARVLHRDGATVLGIDVPQAASELLKVMNEIDGAQLTLDITAKDAPQRIAHHVKE